MGAGKGRARRARSSVPSAPSWDLDERIDEQQLRDHLAQFLGGAWDGPSKLVIGEGAVKNGIREASGGRAT
jgi:hypothetical protein